MCVWGCVCFKCIDNIGTIHKTRKRHATADSLLNNFPCARSGDWQSSRMTDDSECKHRKREKDNRPYAPQHTKIQLWLSFGRSTNSGESPVAELGLIPGGLDPGSNLGQREPASPLGTVFFLSHELCGCDSAVFCCCAKHNYFFLARNAVVNIERL